MTAYIENMNQAATYWAPGASNGVGGIAYGAATAILCRWQDKAVLFRDAQGQEVVSSSIVYVDRQLAAKGKLALGTHAGTPPESAKEIRSLDSSPSLNADETLFKVML